MRRMNLVGVRSTAPDRGLVAVLVEEGGPGMVAVPVTAREGLALTGASGGLPPSWLPLLVASVQALGASVRRGVLDVGPDGELTAHLELDSQAGECVSVPCAPGEALLVAGAQGAEAVASTRLLAQRGVDLSGTSVHEQVARMSAALAGVRAEDFQG